MKKNNSLLYGIIGGVVTCFICVGVIFLFPLKGNSNLNGNSSKLSFSGEVALGDGISCTSCIAQCVRNYPSMSESQCRTTTCSSRCANSSTPTATANSCVIRNCATYVSPRTATNCRCQTCGTNYVPNSNHTACVLASTTTPRPTSSPTSTPTPCPAGMYGTPGNCDSCQPGTYQNSTGQSSCKDCPIGAKCPDSGMTDYKLCESGTYTDTTKQTSCKTCPAGNSCKFGVKTACSGISSYQPDPGKDECLTNCFAWEGYYATPADSDQHTACEIAPVKNVSCKSGYKYIAKGEELNSAYCTAEGPSPQITLKGLQWNSSSNKFSLQPNGENAFVKNGGLEGGSGNGCQNNSATISATNSGAGSGGEATISVCVYCKSWSSSSGHWRLDSGPSLSSASSSPGCIFFSEPDGEQYKKAWNRCCASAIPPNNYGYCYGDEPYIGIASKTKWVYSNKDAQTSEYPYKYPHSMVDNEDECHKMEARSCTTTSPQKETKNLEANACEAGVRMELSKYDIDCSGDGNFYSFSCDQKIYTDFDYGADGSQQTNTNLYFGQGIGYNIKVTTKVSCTATFYPDVWRASYNRVLDKMKKVWSRVSGPTSVSAYSVYMQNNSDNFEKFINNLKTADGSDWDKAAKEVASEIYGLYNLARDIESKVDIYNNYQLKEKYNETATLKMDYVKSKNNDNIINFVRESEKSSDSGKQITHNHSLGISWIKNPSNYKWDLTRETILVPEKVYFDKNNGEVVFNDSGSVVDGGNKIYVDYDIPKDSKITMHILVSGLGGQDANVPEEEHKTSSVKNEKCIISEKDIELSYRQIDVKNPFINTNWPKGENWYNEIAKYDFTKTIHANTWSGSPITVINISKEDVSDLQSSTASYIRSGYSPYIGLCEKIGELNDISSRATTRICEQLKSVFGE